MITVRFPNGLSVQYNDLCWVDLGVNYAYLYRDSDKTGGWRVCVPKDALIEFVMPCRIYNPLMGDADKTEKALWAVSNELRKVNAAVSKLVPTKERVRKRRG